MFKYIYVCECIHILYDRKTFSLGITGTVTLAVCLSEPFISHCWSITISSYLKRFSLISLFPPPQAYDLSPRVFICYAEDQGAKGPRNIIWSACACKYFDVCCLSSKTQAKGSRTYVQSVSTLKWLIYLNWFLAMQWVCLICPSFKCIIFWDFHLQ